MKNKYNFVGHHLLIVDDVAINLRIAKNAMKKVGFTFDCVSNGKLAVEAFENSPVGAYSAILMDIRMPVMGGYEATRKIRAISRLDAATIPIIALSADALPEDVQKSSDCGMNAHVAKPFNKDELCELLFRLILQKNL